MRGAILVAYYEGAYGPTIRLDCQAREDLVAVRDLLARLATGASVEVEVCRALACESEAIEAVRGRTRSGA